MRIYESEHHSRARAISGTAHFISMLRSGRLRWGIFISRATAFSEPVRYFKRAGFVGAAISFGQFVHRLCGTGSKPYPDRHKDFCRSDRRAGVPGKRSTDFNSANRCRRQLRERRSEPSDVGWHAVESADQHGNDHLHGDGNRRVRDFRDNGNGLDSKIINGTFTLPAFCGFPADHGTFTGYKDTVVFATEGFTGTLNGSADVIMANFTSKAGSFDLTLSGTDNGAQFVLNGSTVGFSLTLTGNIAGRAVDWFGLYDTTYNTFLIYDANFHLLGSLHSNSSPFDYIRTVRHP